MSFNKGGTTDQQSAASSAEQQTATSNGGAAKQWSFSNRSASLRSPGRVSSSFQEIKTRIDEAMKKFSDHDVKVIAIDRESSGAYFSMVVFAVRMPQINANSVGFHTVVFGGTNAAPSPIVIGGERNTPGAFVRSRHTSDGFTPAVLSNFVIPAVQARLEKSDSLIYAGATSVTPDKDIKDDNIILGIINNAIAACVAKLADTHDAVETLNLAALSDSCRMKYQLVTGNHQFATEAGDPIRASFVVNVSSLDTSVREAGSMELTGSQAEVPVMSLTGYVSAIYANPAPAYGGYGRQQQNLPQPFAPEITFTSFNGEELMTPQHLALALASMFPAYEQSSGIPNWALPLMNGVTKSDEPALTDFGYLNLTANLDGDPSKAPGFIDTRALEGNAMSLMAAINMLFTPTPIVSVDSPVYGESSWQTDILVKAASNDPKARAALIRAFDKIFNNQFSRVFGESDQIAVSNYLISTGYLTDERGVRHDIRELDTIAMHVLLAKNPAELQRWLATFTAGSDPVSMARALNDREELMRKVTNDMVQFTGTAYHLTFSNAFLSAVHQCYNMMRVNCLVETPISGSINRVVVGAPSFLNKAALGSVSVSGQNFGNIQQSRGGRIGGFGQII